jgi:hypothetical protein
MKWRQIVEREVIEAISSPQKTEPSVFGRKNAYKSIGTKLLKVTYIEEGDKIIVISAVDKNRQEEYCEDRIR